MVRSYYYSQAGFTLAEAMVAMVIAAIFVVSSGLLVSSLTGQAGTAEARQRVRDDVSVALTLLKNDIEAAGTGMPLEAPVQDDLMIAPDVEADVSAMILHMIRDIDPDSNGSSGADELYLGGVGVQSGWVGAIVATVVGVAPDQIEISRIDGPETLVPAEYSPCHSLTDPYVPGQSCGFAQPIYANLVGQTGWVYQQPRLITSIQPLPPPNNHRLLVEFDTDSPRPAKAPAIGQSLLFYRQVINTAGTVLAPGTIPVARWYLQSPGPGLPGQLRRQVRFEGPANAAGAEAPATVIGNDEVMLDGVVDFQVSFLVWPCRGQPTWVDHLINEVVPGAAGNGHFDRGGSGNFDPNNSALANADRFMAMRQRLLSIRVSLLLQTQSAASGSDMSFPTGSVVDLQLDNHLNVAAMLDATREYFTTQQAFDPLNIRLKTPLISIYPYPPVRDAATDLDTFAAGFCRGRR